MTREFKAKHARTMNVSVADIMKPSVSGTGQPKLPNIRIMPNNLSNKAKMVNVDNQSMGSAEHKFPVQI